MVPHEGGRGEIGRFQLVQGKHNAAVPFWEPNYTHCMGLNRISVVLFVKVKALRCAVKEVLMHRQLVTRQTASALQSLADLDHLCPLNFTPSLKLYTPPWELYPPPVPQTVPSA